jgi:hypothetical protein
LTPNLVDCVEGTRANGLPDAEIPELHGLRWLIDNATITEAQPSSVNCNTDVWSAALWDGACIAVTERNTGSGAIFRKRAQVREVSLFIINQGRGSSVVEQPVRNRGACQRSKTSLNYL